jgi:hypothetical protein
MSAIAAGVKKTAPRAKSAAKMPILIFAPLLIRISFQRAIAKLDYPILMI